MKKPHLKSLPWIFATILSVGSFLYLNSSTSELGLETVNENEVSSSTDVYLPDLEIIKKTADQFLDLLPAN
ncbi:MAG: hypothetical protein ACPG5P_07445 [Saprospiraceae bacterium]